MVSIAELQSIDLSQNTMLRVLDLSFNQLNQLDLSSNPLLIEFNLRYNQFSSFDFTPWNGITHLTFDNNLLTDINIGEQPLLQHVELFENQLSSVEIGGSPDLRRLIVHDNNLQRLVINHGSDQFNQFNARNNPELNCIEVLDVAYHEERFTYENNSIDEGVVFSEECGSVALVNPESISEILYDHESVVRTLTILMLENSR